MRLVFALITLLFACVPYADLREYHYDRPQQPLHIGAATQTQTIVLRESFVQPQATARYYGAPAAAAPSVQTSPAAAIAHSYGHAGTAHIIGQLPTVVATQGGNQYAAPHYQSRNGANQAGEIAAAISASYYSQPGQLHYTTPNANPLTQYSQQQQQQQQAKYVNLPQPQQQYSQKNYAANGQQQQYAGGASYNGGGSVAGSYGVGGAGVGLAIGQTLPLDGKYISQSEIGQLHSYLHQQQPVGDTRPFSRQVTTCYPNGQCQRKTLAPGQLQHTHQHAVHVTRAKTLPVSDKCRLLEEAKKVYNLKTEYGYGGNSYDHHGPEKVYVYTEAKPKRPHDRRLFPYSEVVLPNDPYN